MRVRYVKQLRSEIQSGRTVQVVTTPPGGEWPEAARMAFFDDSLENVEGARAIGLRAVHVRSNRYPNW
jgi:hypothetical protein